MYCGKCGKQNDEAARFCTHCGAGLTAARSVGGESGDGVDFRATIVAEAIARGKLLAGRYRVIERIGVGGMGEVFKAVDAEMDDMAVAVKVLPPLLARNKRSIQDLKREAAIALRLTHSSICRLHNFHSDGQIKFLVMEMIEGLTLEQILADRDDGKMPWSELEPVARQIASALEYAHGLAPPVLHRDIKPSNIMVLPSGTAKLLDFGIAREMQDSMTRLSGQMSSAGTLPYMSPEQFRGEPLDPRSDIYSLCVVLCEALSGVAMVNPGGSVAWQVQEKKFQPLGDAPAEANAILAAGLKKNRNDRVRILFRDTAASVPVADVDDASVAGMPVAKPPRAEPAKKPVEPPPRVRAMPLVKLELDPLASQAPPAAIAVAAAPPARPPAPPSGMAVFLRVIGALPVVSLPITLPLLIAGLGRHVRARLGSSALAGERFQSGEGLAVVAKLRRCAGRTGRPGLMASLILAPIMLAALGYLFIVPTMAPWPFDDYGDVLENVLSCSSTERLVFPRGKFDYDVVKHHASLIEYDIIRETYPPDVGKGKMSGGPSSNDLQRVDLTADSSSGRPYTFSKNQPFEGTWQSEGKQYALRVNAFKGAWQSRGKQYLVRVQRVRCHWSTSRTLGEVFYAVFVPLLVLSSGWVFVTYVLRFVHHRTAEARAARIATGDAKFTAEVTRANHVTIAVAACMLLTGTFLILAPLLCAGWLPGHNRWQRQCGLDAALGASMAQ